MNNIIFPGNYITLSGVNVLTFALVEIDLLILNSSLEQYLPVCQVGLTASGTWKFPNLLSMTNEKVLEPDTR